VHLDHAKAGHPQAGVDAEDAHGARCATHFAGLATR